MLNDFDQKIEKRLKDLGLRATRHRIRVLAVLEEAGVPMSHVELLQKIQRDEAGFDRVTLYRVLSALKDAGLIHQVQGSDGVWRFCGHVQDEGSCPGGHPHLLCEVCGGMQCLTHQRVPHYDVPSDFEVKHKQMLLIGICGACRTKK